jgi:DNA-binding transcriptional ArsR family regulator
MKADVDPALLSLFGSRTRLLTMAALASAQEPLTGYRVAAIAGLPREKVYPELRKGVAAGLLTSARDGFRMVDADIRSLLRKRVRVRWDKEWDRARAGWDEETRSRLTTLLASIPTDSTYLRPEGWTPSPSARKAIREMERPPSKDALLRRRGLRSSDRTDWASRGR